MLERLMTGKLGWKTLAGVALLLVAVVADITGWLSAANVDRLFGIGQAVGLVGLRDALSKLSG